MKTIVITGGAGFVGSHLCDFFIEKGYQVICIDNLITGSVDNIAHLTANSHFKFIRHDICEHIDLKSLLKEKADINIECVLHFASPASPIDYIKYPIQTLKVGSLGTHNALGLAKAWGTGFLLASTSEVYGDPLVHPQTEDYWGHVNPIGIRSCYDESKRFAEAMTMAYHRVHKLNTRIVRIFNTYGPRMRKEDGRVVPAFIEQALKGTDLTVFGDGSQTRSFCYVSDLVEGIYRLMKSDINSPVNIGNPAEITVEQFAREIIAIVSSNSKIVYRQLPADDPKRRRPDISKAKEKLGWQPKVGLTEGLRKTIEWFKKN